jgi:hypothetical protein
MMDAMGDAPRELAALPADLSSLSDDEVVAQACLTEAHIDAAKHRLLRLVREIDERELFADHGFATTAAFISYRLHLGPVTAREHVRIARALSELPRIDEGLRKAELSYSKARAMTRVATPENEAELVDMAKNATAGQLERICRLARGVQREEGEGGAPLVAADERWVRFFDTPDGMVDLHARLLPDEAARIRKVLDDIVIQLRADGCGSAPRLRSATTPNHAEAAEGRPPPRRSASADGAALFGDHASAETSDASAETPTEASTSAGGAALSGDHGDPLAAALEAARELAERRKRERIDHADAFVAAFETYLAVGGPKTRRVADRHTLDIALTPGFFRGDAYRATLEDGTVLHPATLARIACDCRVRPSLLDAGGNTIDEGRKKRLITAALERAVLKRDGPCCAFPGCNRRHGLQAHHIESWLSGGLTNRDNLCYLCEQHHRAVHEGGYSVALGPHGPVFEDPRGRVIDYAPKRGAMPEDPVDALRRAHERAGLTLTANTAALESYTPRPDYDACIRGLV